MPDNVLIATTAGNVSSELTRRGIGPEERVVIMRLSDWLAEIRKETRDRVIAAGLSDDDIDRLIADAREEVQHLIK
jgi:hypothetical protein